MTVRQDPPAGLTVGELAAWVAGHLRTHGIDVVLSGGSVVSIYSSNAYVSQDLDFIETSLTTRRQLRLALGELGWTERDRYFVHPRSDYLLEFPSGPLSVGDEPLTDIAELEFSTGSLRLLSPTDCVRDRLAAYYHWGDRQSLEQAVLVARARPVDLELIRKWSRRERSLPAFEEFLARVMPHSGTPHA